MDNLSLSDETQNSSTRIVNDIPEALRDKEETPPSTSSSWQRGLIIGGGLAVSAIALLVITLTILAGVDRQTQEVTMESVPSSPSPSPSPSPANEVENLLGHLPYAEAPEDDLKAVTSDGRIRLRSSAANKFQEMRKAAQAQGVNLVPLSGFRTVSQQESLFFDIAEQRNQLPTTRAEVSAPPGYSEHHTGYTIDIGDGKVPAVNLSPRFDQTAAFKWLEQNAVRYGFELSFPKDNPQGISYEPWHWRFIGDRDSLETFYKARNLQNTQE